MRCRWRPTSRLRVSAVILLTADFNRQRILPMCRNFPDLFGISFSAFRAVGRPVMMVAAVAIVAAFVWLVLALSGWLQQRIGARGQAMIPHFMGLVLVAIGAQLVLTGIADFLGLRGAVPT